VLSLALVLAAAALVCVPTRRSAARLRALTGTMRGPWRSPRPRLGPLPALGGLCIAVAAVLGPGGAVATGLLGAAAWRHRRARRVESDRIEALQSMAEALDVVVVELRAGAHPAPAVESAAKDASGEVAAALRSIAHAARLGCDPGTAAPPGAGLVAEAFERLTRAWSLAQRHGLPLADLLAAVQRDVAASARFAGQTVARMAGPRAGAAVLAVLPAAGIALGEVMGAGPVQVLTGTVPGQVLFVLGSVLVFAGVAWTCRLTARTVL
jgi:tight adherence protein B